MDVFKRVKYATIGRWRIEKQMEKLKEQVANLRDDNEEYLS